jgi:hypothetical protein
MSPTIDQVIETVATYFRIDPQAVRCGHTPTCVEARRYALLLASTLCLARAEQLAGEFLLDQDEVAEILGALWRDARASTRVQIELDMLGVVLALKAQRPWYGLRLDRVVVGLAREMRPRPKAAAA